MAYCNKCSYNWESRVDNPKACPRCKTRLDYKPSAEISKLLDNVKPFDAPGGEEDE